ncbi:MAG: histidinol-phosphate transaminase [Candidatus Paracaedibacteraceae bacterium]|nr:histidinol-phosphate transaminase [Candidatus Paracaedibacteraceae bacterium]
MKSPHASLYQIIPYIGGNNVPPNFIQQHNLASNENPFGASKAVYEMLSTFSNVHTYPDGTATQLKSALSHTFGIPAINILCGCGSEELLHLLARTYLSPGDEVLIPEYGFGVYAIAALSVSAIPKYIPREGEDKALKIANILTNITHKTKMIYIDHPGNPIGNFLHRDELKNLLSALPSSVILVLDAAYAEYLQTDHTYTAGHEFVTTHPNVVVTRSFSKAYGLAGLRLGWMHASETIINSINHIRAPFNTSIIAQKAGITALNDPNFVKKTVNFTHLWRKKFEVILTEKKITFIPSCSNFVLIHLPNRANSFYKNLGENGFIVRPMTQYNLHDYLRISIGTENSMINIFKYFNSIYK